MRIARLLVLGTILAAPLGAQVAPRVGQPRPSSLYDAGFVIGADWLQGNALSMERKTLPSVAADISWRTNGWAINGGWLRIARELSTIQGGTLTGGRLFSLGPVLFIPNVGILAGQTYASRDSTGYDFVGPDGLPGHQARFDYSESFTFGGGVGLTIEVPVFRAIGIRVMTSEWGFSGQPLQDDRFRWVVGAGLSLRVTR
ncbi:MAG TPA: hypothetical protein VIP11_17010 [Gemmatimonadaceae bacterium]